MRPDQIEALEFMLDDYGVEGLLNAVADALGRKASWLRCAPLATEHGSAVKRYMLQAEALRAQASALAAGRALTYATQAPLGVMVATMRMYPVASLLPKGAKLEHVEHGPCTVIKTSKKDPHCVWVRMDDDGIEGTVDIRLLRWRETS